MAGFKAVHCSNGWTMPQAAESVKREKSGRFGMLFHHRLDDLDNFFLLTAGQLGGGLKNQLQTALGGLAFGFGRGDAKQHVHAHAQGICDLGSTSPRGGLSHRSQKAMFD